MIRDQVMNELSAPVDPESFYVGNPARVSGNSGALASPLTLRVTLNGIPALGIGDGIWFDDIWAVLTPTAALTIQSASLRLVDNTNGVLKTLGMPVFTTLSLSTSPVTVAFLVQPKLVGFGDLQQYGLTANIQQPLKVELILAFSASTLVAILGVKARLVRGIQDG